MERLEKYSLPKFAFSCELSINDCGDDCTLLTLKNSSQDELANYIKELKSAGFKEHTSERKIAGNTFYSLVKDEVFVYAYFISSTATAKVVCGPSNTLFIPESYAGEQKYSSSMSLVGQEYKFNCGACVIYRISDGRLIIHDGGDVFKGKPDYIYRAMKEIVGESDITIAAWIFTHPHCDHQAGAIECMINHADDIKIENIVFNYAPAEYYDFKRNDGIIETSSADVKKLFEAIDAVKCKQNTKVIKAHTGEVYTFADATVEILFTIEDFLPTQINYCNSNSLVARINVAGSSSMLLADTTHESGRVLENMWGNALESDMVQLAHHGMWASNTSLYETIKAKNIIWSQSIYFTKDWYRDKPVAAAIALADNIYIAGDGVLTVDLPASGSNKANVIKQIEAVEK